MHVVQTVVPTAGGRAPLEAIAMERFAQNAKFGVQHHLDGTSNTAETRCQRDFDQAEGEDAEREDRCTWQLILQEEISEAFAESDPAKLRAELVQAAAVICAWIEDIDSRESVQVPITDAAGIKWGMAYIQDELDGVRQRCADRGIVLMGDFTIKDSGQRMEYDSGMVRDTTDGKPRFDLMWPEGVPYNEQFMARIGMHLAKGIAKYGERNWEKADSEQELARFWGSLDRHINQARCGATDEDHLAAAFFNLLSIATVQYKIRMQLGHSGRT